MRLEPLYDRVVLTEVPTEGVTPSGLFLPESARPDVLEGLVVSKGPDAKTARKGDRVLFHVLTGRTVVLKDTEYRILREGEILVILREDAA